MEFLEVLSSRRSVPSFDPSVSIDRTVLLEILNTANLAPSSMCLQQWEYIVCDTPEAKARLQAASFNQKKITVHYSISNPVFAERLVGTFKTHAR